jgi:aspartate--ammonia ligase
MAYVPKLSLRDTERAIKLVKDSFQTELASRLNLARVSAPRFLKVGTGLQDDLAGTQEPVGFHVKFDPARVEMVHSLAKWKRYALEKYGFTVGEGLYTDMDAIRKDEVVDEIHSVYVDQWDWERVIHAEDRHLGFLKSIVQDIYAALRATERMVHENYAVLKPRLPEDIAFLHTEDLETRYPALSPSEREHEAAKEYGAVFLIGIGHPLQSGKPHDARAVDYDDWWTQTVDDKRGLNGDIIVWDTVRQRQLELSSMGIRVDAAALRAQTAMTGLEDRLELPFHQGILDGSLPLCVGGGIGQSRLCMLLLQKAHIGEVQVSVWPEEMVLRYGTDGVKLL